MTKILHVMQDHVSSCSPLVYGDYVYVCTGNGRWKTTGKPFYPLTPSLIALDKHTGQLAARDDEQIGEQLWRGQWSSPSLAMVNGKAQILFATGNGVCYGFEPVDPAAKFAPDRWITASLRGPIVSYIDVTAKDIAGLSAEEYARKFNPLDPALKPALPVEFRYAIGMPVTTPVDSIPMAQVPDVPILKKIWSFDCLPPEYTECAVLCPPYQWGWQEASVRYHPHAGLLSKPGLRFDRRGSESWQQEEQRLPGLHRRDEDRRHHQQRESLGLRPVERVR